MNPSQQPQPNQQDSSPKSLPRRGFLKTLGIAAASMITGGVIQYEGNKYLIKEKELNDFFARFEGKEMSFIVAVDASNLLRAEMERDNIQTVTLSGTGHPNNRIEILRNFLTRHLQTKGIGDRYAVQKSIIEGGVYDKENLVLLTQQAQYFSTQKETPPIPPKYEIEKSIV